MVFRSIQNFFGLSQGESETQSPQNAGNAPPLSSSEYDLLADMLISIPAPAEFQKKTWSNNIKTSIKTNIGFYDGDYDKNKNMSGLGRLFNDGHKEFISGRWKNNCLVELHSCQFFIEDQNLTIYIRKQNMKYLFTIDEMEYVAFANFINNSPLQLGNSFNNARLHLFSKINIIQTLKDSFKIETESLVNEFKSLMDWKSENTVSSEECAEDFLQIGKILTRYKNMDLKPILSEISMCTFISKGLQKISKNILEKLSEYEKRCKSLPIKDDTQFNEVHKILTSKSNNVLSKHVDNLRKSCPSIDSPLFHITRDLTKKIYGERVLLLKSDDIMLFKNLIIMINCLNTNVKDELIENIKNIWEKFIIKISKLKNVKSIKEIGPLTNSVYLNLYKNFLEQYQEFVKENEECTINFNNDGCITFDESNCKMGNKDFKHMHFLSNLANHFNPGTYYFQNRFEYSFMVLNIEENVSSIPDEKLVWLYILDNFLVTNFNDDIWENINIWFDCVFHCFINITTSAKIGNETLRVVTNNVIKFISVVGPYFLNNNTDLEKDILNKQIKVLESIFNSDGEIIPDRFTDLMSIYNDYWSHRESIIEKIIDKFPYEFYKLTLKNITNKLLCIVKLLLSSRGNMEEFISCYRSYNQFLKLLDGVDFSWIIKLDSTSSKSYVSVLNSDKNTYKVTKINEFINEKENYPKHYTIEVIDTLLDIIIICIANDKGWNKIKVSSSLVRTIGKCLKHLEKQQNYTDFEQFLTDITKPFISVIESTDTDDFENRLKNIENFYCYTREDEINILKALELFTTETFFRNALYDFDGSFDTKILESCYQKYLTEFECSVIENENSNLEAINKILKETEAVEINKLSTEFKQNVIPIILGRISAIWSILESKDIASTGKKLKPHCIQILCILRLLSVDNINIGITHHLAQVLTGQGKSIVLGLLSTLLALIGFNVRVVCYNQYLANRDETTFKKFFRVFSQYNLIKRINYSDFENMADDVLKFEINGVEENLRSITTKVVTNELKNQEGTVKGSNFDKTILLIDEVDVFFSENFYGNTYNPGRTLILPELGEIQIKIWEMICNSHFDNLNDIKKDILNRLRDLTETMVHKNIDSKFSVIITLSKNFMFEHFGKMIEDAFCVKRGDRADKFKITKNGDLCYRKDDGLYTTTTYFRYENAFHYIKLKKCDFEVKNRNYSYLCIPCGNVSYARLPNEFCLILGVSGTLNTLNSPEREAVKSYSINKISCMPSFFGLHKLQFDTRNDFSIIDSEGNWLNKIYDHINKTINNNRAVLVFFDTEKELNDFKNKYGNNIDRLHVLTGNEPNSKLEFYVSEAGIARTVTLATRNMGRGVDFKSDDCTVESNGGVHVIQTFLSIEEKEETQIKGRTARKDNKGSYELIIYKEHLHNDLKKVSNYKDICDERRKLEEENRKNDNENIKKSDEKHNKTMDYLKSFSSYTIDKRQKYLDNFPIVYE